MTFDEWQNAPKRIAAWRELMATELFKDAMSALDSISPSERATAHKADHATENACVLLGQIQGYKWILQNMRILAMAKPEMVRQPTPNYGYEPEKAAPSPSNKRK